MGRKDYLEGLYYEVKGKGEAIIFLHGIAGSSNMFKPQVKKLSQLYKTVAVDLKGNGRSDSVKTTRYVDVHIDSIENLMDHLGIEKAIFVGLSYGGIITQYFAIKHPTRVSKMVLIDTYAQTFPKNYSEVKLILLAAFVMASSWIPKELLKRSLTRMAPYKKWKLAQREMISIAYKSRPKDVTIQLLEVFNINLLNDLNQLDVPVLVIVGDCLKSVVDKSKEIVEHLKNGRICVVENSFDPTNLCQPKIVNEVIMNFINEKSLYVEMKRSTGV